MRVCFCSLGAYLVYRLRYNISTYETDGFGTEDGKFDDSSMNKNPPITQDPNIQVSGKNLTLTVNTNQLYVTNERGVVRRRRARACSEHYIL